MNQILFLVGLLVFSVTTSAASAQSKKSRQPQSQGKFFVVESRRGDGMSKFYIYKSKAGGFRYSYHSSQGVNLAARELSEKNFIFISEKVAATQSKKSDSLERCPRSHYKLISSDDPSKDFVGCFDSGLPAETALQELWDILRLLV